MRRLIPTLLALVLLSALVAYTAFSARSTDRSALGHAAAIGPLPSGAVALPPPVACSLVTAGPPDGAGVELSGACTGTVTGPVECSDEDGDVSASVQGALRNGLHLTLSLIAPDAHEGRLANVAVFAQVDRSGGAERWSNRSATVDLDAHGTMSVDVSLAAEPGTGSPGTLSVKGSIDCVEPPR